MGSGFPEQTASFAQKTMLKKCDADMSGSTGSNRAYRLGSYSKGTNP
jgi:hypothetical protein